MQKNERRLKRLNHLVSEINSLYHEAAVREQISDSEQCILYALCEEGGSCLQSHICVMSGISRQTINTAVKKMVREGFLLLDAGEGRNTIVRWTEAGKALAEKKVLPLYEAENGIFESWEEEEVQAYLDYAARYRDELAKIVRGKGANEK